MLEAPDRERKCVSSSCPHVTSEDRCHYIPVQRAVSRKATYAAHTFLSTNIFLQHSTGECCRLSRRCVLPYLGHILWWWRVKGVTRCGCMCSASGPSPSSTHGLQQDPVSGALSVHMCCWGSPYIWSVEILCFQGRVVMLVSDAMKERNV